MSFNHHDHSHHHIVLEKPHSIVRRRPREKWDVPASQMARNTVNPIRQIVDGMELTPNPDKQMIALSIGDPTVFGNLKPCLEIHNAVLKSLESHKHNGYSPSIGYEKARAAVAKYYGVPDAPLKAKDVILASGGSGAIEIVINCMVNPGQNILVPRPGFSLYATLAEVMGIHIRYYDLLPERRWEIDLDHLESLLDNQTALIIINNPSNPCGSVFSRQHIQDIMSIAEAYKVPILGDEIYAHFVFTGEEYVPLAAETRDVPILSVGGLTKRFIVPGWRMGWILIHDRHDVLAKEVRDGLFRLSQRILGPNTIVQGALEDILAHTPQYFFNKTISVVQNNARICYREMKKVTGLAPVMPSGAMYMMIGIDMDKFPAFTDDVEFTQRLVSEQSVFALPGQCFNFPNYFRVVLTLPEVKLQEACVRIAEFCHTHYCSDGDGLHDQPNGMQECS